MALQLDAFLPYRLNRIAAGVSTALKEVYGRRFDLTVPEWRVLAALGEHGSMTATAIGRHAALHKTKVSRAVGGLEARRWLKRAENPEDRRIEFLSLTTLGQEAYRAIVPHMLDFETRLADRLGADGMATVLAALDRLEAALALNP